MALNFLKENMKIRTFLCSSTKLVVLPLFLVFANPLIFNKEIGNSMG